MASNNYFDSEDDDFGTRPPFFNGKEYYIWKNRMQIFVKGIDFDAWDAIQNGPFIPTHIVDDGLTKVKLRSEWTNDDKKKVHSDSRAKHLISCAVSNDEFSNVINCDTAQEMWNVLRDIHEGTGEVKIAKIGFLTREYELFSMKPSENVHDMEMWFYKVVNHLASLGKKIPNEEKVNKVLRCLSRNWRHKVRTIEKSSNFSTMPLSSLFKELEEHEIELKRLDKNDETHKKNKNKGHVAVSSRKGDDEEDDNDHSEGMEFNNEEMNLLVKDFFKLLKKNKKSINHVKKQEHMKKGSSSLMDHRSKNW